MPIGALLGISAVNEVLGIPFRGSAASVVFKVPGLRCFQIMGLIEVSRKSILAAVKKGLYVGIVSDGIKGMFKATTSKDDVEVLAIKNSKGIAKLALVNDLNVGVVHWFGNSAALIPMVDPLGIMEALSRRLRMSLLLFRGRFGCTPLPTRQPIVMALGDPIMNPAAATAATAAAPPTTKSAEGPSAESKKSKPKKVSQKAIDELHDQLLSGHLKLFEELRGAFDWENRELLFA
jgi:hypothetical protein